ncbi:MAG TPA: SLC13 family permease [Candidatus Sulfotelmatobacter sp.]|jgi:di/tricarboxylate transporter|nr:SLC13 family permease [Candidatus Sulfotelmatobacter sp.]
MRLSLSKTIAAAAVGSALLVALIRPLSGPENAALALAVAALGLFATAAIPEYITALGFFTLAMLFKVAAPSVVFTGFESAALWLIFGGLVVGVAVKSTGLGERIAQGLAPRFGDGYWGVVTGVTVVGVALGFIMPSSMGRAVLLMPIAMSLADRFGFEPGSKGRSGVLIAAAFGCHVPTFSVLPANVPNVVFAGAAETLYHWSPTYGSYLLLHFPVLGFLKTVLMIPMIVWMWPDQPKPRPALPPASMSRDERWLALLIAAALALWATDFWHRISPAWISMAVAVILLLPHPKLGLVGRKAFSEQINYGSLFYVAGIMALGALVDKSGLGARMAQAILNIAPLVPNQPAMNFASLSLISTVVSMVTTLPGAPSVLTPLAGQMAEASGLPLPSVLMSQVLGFSNPVLPYESAPLIVALQIGGERMEGAVKLCLLLALVSIVLLLPLNYLWWRLLGWI